MFWLEKLLHGFSIIPTRYENVPIWKTHGRYRKQMKRGYSKLLYGQRNKNETIVSVIKRLFGEHITSRLVRTQNRELSFRCIAYNTHRITNLTIIIEGFYKASVNVKRVSIAISLKRRTTTADTRNTITLSKELVEACFLESDNGIAIVLLNWSDDMPTHVPNYNLTIRINNSTTNIPVPM